MEESEEWILAVEGARLLGITPQGVLRLVRRRGLSCRLRNPELKRSLWLFRRDEIMGLVGEAERVAQARNREQREEKQLLGEPPMEEAWVSTPQAAALLNVAPRTVRWMVEAGLLHSRQKEAGKRGSRHFIMKKEVERLLREPQYQHWHTIHPKGKPNLGRGRNTEYVPDPDELIPHWLATKHVMYLFGVSRTTVRAIRKSGRVEINYVWPFGYLHWRDDLFVLMQDPVYLKRREAWRKSHPARIERAQNALLQEQKKETEAQGDR